MKENADEGERRRRRTPTTEERVEATKARRRQKRERSDATKQRRGRRRRTAYRRATWRSVAMAWRGVAWRRDGVASRRDSETARLRVREPTSEGEDTIVAKRTPTEVRNDARAENARAKGMKARAAERGTPKPSAGNAR